MDPYRLTGECKVVLQETCISLNSQSGSTHKLVLIIHEFLFWFRVFQPLSLPWENNIKGAPEVAHSFSLTPQMLSSKLSHDHKALKTWQSEVHTPHFHRGYPPPHTEQLYSSPRRYKRNVYHGIMSPRNHLPRQGIMVSWVIKIIISVKICLGRTTVEKVEI
jgi:hypothetical protein